MGINKKGVWQNGLIEQDGNVRIYGEDLAIGANLVSSNIGLENDSSGENDLTVTPMIYQGISGWRLKKTVTSGWGSYIYLPVTPVGLDKTKKYSLSFYVTPLSPSNVVNTINILISNGSSTNHFINNGSIAMDSIGKTYKVENFTPKSDFNATVGTGNYGYHWTISKAPCDVFIGNVKLEEGSKATPWIPNINDNLIAGSFGGSVNKNLAPQNGEAIRSHFQSTITWEDANKWYKIVSPIATNATYGTGFSLKSQYYKLPWGQTYRASMEIFLPTAHSATLDFNNNTLGNTLLGND